MKPLSKLRQTVIGGTLLLAGLGSSALTLGLPRGVVVFGQPLNVVIPVQTDNGEDAAAQCYEADVFHANNRVEGRRVSVTVEPGAQPQELNVRVRSALPIDEPIVFIYLRSGCLQRSTRRYVLQADLAAEVIAPIKLPSVARQAVAPPNSNSSVQSAALSASQAPAPVPSPAAARARARAAAANKAPPTAPTRAAAERAAVGSNAPGTAAPTAPVASKAARAAVTPAPLRDSVVRRRNEGNKSRLKFDPLDLLAESDPVLRSSSELTTTPSEDVQVRCQGQPNFPHCGNSNFPTRLRSVVVVV